MEEKGGPLSRTDMSGSSGTSKGIETKLELVYPGDFKLPEMRSGKPPNIIQDTVQGVQLDSGIQRHRQKPGPRGVIRGREQ